MRGFFHRKDVAQQAAGPASRGTVLVVDDSPTQTRALINALVKDGFRVETASNGEEGVRTARRLHPDIILMDVIMPVLNGFQATRLLHQDPSTAAIPVIIVSGKDQQTDRYWGLRQGAAEYLVKPVDPDELLAKVRMVLGER